MLPHVSRNLTADFHDEHATYLTENMSEIMIEKTCFQLAADPDFP